MVRILQYGFWPTAPFQDYSYVSSRAPASSSLSAVNVKYTSCPFPYRSADVVFCAVPLPANQIQSPSAVAFMTITAAIPSTTPFRYPARTNPARMLPHPRIISSLPRYKGTAEYRLRRLEDRVMAPAKCALQAEGCGDAESSHLVRSVYAVGYFESRNAGALAAGLEEVLVAFQR
jgi:hypothetical protein